MITDQEITNLPFCKLQKVRLVILDGMTKVSNDAVHFMQEDEFSLYEKAKYALWQLELIYDKVNSRIFKLEKEKREKPTSSLLEHFSSFHPEFLDCRSTYA